MKDHPRLKSTIVVQGLLILCGVLILTAISCLFIYGIAVFKSIGNSDRSLLFWYLPFLLFALIAAKFAIRTGFMAFEKKKALTGKDHAS